MQKVHLLLFDQRKLCAAIERSEEEEEGRRAMMMMAFAAPIYSYALDPEVQDTELIFCFVGGKD